MVSLKLILPAFLMITAPLAQAQDTPTYAERLGFPKGKKVFVLHVDDAGMSYEANQGTIRATSEGIANSTSVMMPCPWVPHFMAYYKQHPTLDVGVHLTLTSEWKGYRWSPLAGRSVVPGLHDVEGAFWPNVAKVVEKATPDEVEAEMRAQIARFRAFGVEPTHLDSHMGTLFQPKFIERYVKMGISERIPILFPGGHAALISKESKLPAAQMGMIRTIGQQVWKAGLPVFDDLDGTSYGWIDDELTLTDAELQKRKTDQFINLFSRAQPGLTYIIMHCADTSPQFKQISPSGPTRRGDMLSMLDPRLKQYIQREGIILTTMRELAERRKNAKE
ncbi:MAG: ChbG/HpnK family deacetylase [Cytophagales bacterium]|nr:MAG: ChbG/HpnK family deacetylase [Cytophagales bacterium]